MRRYELVLILGPQVAEDEVPATFDGLIRQPVEGRGGTVEKVDHWGRRKLAYPIRKQLEGSYVVTHLRLDPPQVKELEQTLKISEEVLRYLFVRLDEPEAPKAEEANAAEVGVSAGQE